MRSDDGRRRLQIPVHRLWVGYIIVGQGAGVCRFHEWPKIADHTNQPVHVFTHSQTARTWMRKAADAERRHR